jgi:hypothetical protein
MCGEIKFFDIEPDNNNSNKINEEFLCIYCKKNEYCEDIDLTEQICGACFLEKLYKAPTKILTNLKTRKAVSYVVNNIKFFRNLTNINIEDFIYEKCKKDDFKTINEILTECSNNSGISKIILKNIFYARMDKENNNNNK